MWIILTLMLLIAQPIEATPNIRADSAILIDIESQTVLFEKNTEEAMHPASTTKLLTALLVSELGNLSDTVTVSKKAAYTPGSSMGLHTDDRLPLEDLLAGLMIKSGNDAAVAIAEHMAGSVANFSWLMNTRSLGLGNTSSHFVNPHGLTAKDHYVSVADLARISLAVFDDSVIRRFAATKNQTIFFDRGQDGDLDRLPLTNTNRLLRYYWVDGLKTGTTSAAGQCLVSSGKQGNQHLLAIVLDSPNRWNESYTLLNWGFDEYTTELYIEQYQHVTTRLVSGQYLRLLTKEPIWISYPKDSRDDLKVVISALETLNAPVEAGQTLGSISVIYQGEVLGRSALIADRSIKKTFWLR